MGNGKIGTYLGFCVKARKIVYGADDIEKQRKDVFLIITDEKLGQNSLKLVRKAQERLGCSWATAEAGVLASMLYRPAIKAVAIKDKNLAFAILSVLESESQFKLFSGGNN